MAEYIRQDHHLPHGSLEPTITNADRIRMMSDEELAELFGKSDAYCPPLECPIPNEVCTPKVCWLEWLRKEADEEQM